jgi:hypothetical protein
MKKFICITVYLTFFSVNLFSQDNILSKEQISAKNGSKGPILNATNWDKLVPLAQKYYNRKQASTMPDLKIKQVNFLYSQSFIVSKSDCKINENELDFNAFNHLRKAGSRVKVPVAQKGCAAEIELLSIDELNSEFEKIKKENN